ncbi:Aspartic proteinase-like protein 2 [Acorus gramineus]|uniref:Aspartic proteinase-like protein 2 n=1 Tax=Acorus gramineus TaxID=55184 RepID=A0AAV9AJ64_ACOGR|nr:Aspartic proteinase-like protein 2 [Acorus gramineus]
MMTLGLVRSGLVVVVVGLLHFAASDVVAGGLFPTALRLERAALPRAPGGRIKVDELVSRDRSRHGRLLRSSVSAVSAGGGGGGVVDFSVGGSGDPFTVGLYFTRVKLGNPAKEFYVQIDTGSDILWVTCASCTGCPTSSGLGITLESFDPSKSSTSSAISCSDKRCGLSSQTSEAVCSQNSQCGYTFQYGDGSGTSGYYVSDTLYFGSVMTDESISNSSTSVVFGCSNSQSGDLTKPDRAVDGIFGFGQNGMSVISQLSSQGVAPKVFSHCLKGTDNGGGILVLGHIVEPGITYTPLVQSQPHYNLNLLSIAVNGKTLSIDSSVFSTSSNQGTIVDSGTTLAYLADKAYDPFVNAIIAAVPQSVRSLVVKGNQCFVTASSPDDAFPSVILNFEGSASMNIKPDDYLLQQGSLDGSIIYCIGWQKNEGSGITILGDLVLKDKIFVYDLEAQRIGWASYDCSLPVNVSSSSPTGRNEFVNTGQLNTNTAPSRPNLIQLGVLAFAVNLIVTGISRL